MTKARVGDNVSIRIVHILCSVLLVFMLMTAGFLGVVPAYKAREAQKTQRSTLVAVTENLDIAGASHSELEQNVFELRQRIASYGYSLKPVETLNRRLADITRMLEENELVIGTLQPRAVVEGERVDFVPLQIEAAGSLESVISLLGNMEQEHPDLHVINISIEYAGPETMRLRTEVNWYVLPKQNP